MTGIRAWNTSLAASVYSNALRYPGCRILNQIFLRHIGVGTAGSNTIDFWTHRISRRIGTSEGFTMGFARLPLPSMVRFGGVGGFFAFPSVQVRKSRPASGFFASRQTFMPEFDQPPFYIDRSKRHGGPVSYIAGSWAHCSRRVFPMCQSSGIGIRLRVITIYFRSQRDDGS